MPDLLWRPGASFTMLSILASPPHGDRCPDPGGGGVLVTAFNDTRLGGGWQGDGGRGGRDLGFLICLIGDGLRAII